MQNKKIMQEFLNNIIQRIKFYFMQISMFFKYHDSPFLIRIALVRSNRLEFAPRNEKKIRNESESKK